MTDQTFRSQQQATVDVGANLAEVLARIADAERAGDRTLGSVQLVAVSKGHDAARAEAALVAGHRVFGENRVQEAQAKWPALRERFPDAVLHGIGGLQTNKAEDAVALFDVIETLDRPKLAKELAKAMDKIGRRPTCFIQVNTGEEPQKSGILPADAAEFVRACREDYDLPVAGLMCIPPVDENPALHFAFLAELADRVGLDQLSMGMSADFETAIRFGATHVRVGTAVFGARPARD